MSLSPCASAPANVVVIVANWPTSTACPRIQSLVGSCAGAFFAWKSVTNLGRQVPPPQVVLDEQAAPGVEPPEQAPEALQVSPEGQSPAVVQKIGAGVGPVGTGVGGAGVGVGSPGTGVGVACAAQVPVP